MQTLTRTPRSEKSAPTHRLGAFALGGAATLAGWALAGTVGLVAALFMVLVVESRRARFHEFAAATNRRPHMATVPSNEPQHPFIRAPVPPTRDLLDATR